MTETATGRDRLPMFWLLLAAQMSSDVQLVDRLVGEYRHTGDLAEQQQVEVAIERVVGEMIWIARDIARDRLLSTNQIPRALKIVRNGDRVRIAFDGREREASVGALPIQIVGMTGDELAYTLQILSSSLVQRFEGERGGRINAIRVEGDTVVVRVTIFSEKLPANVVYELRYLRVR